MREKQMSWVPQLPEQETAATEPERKLLMAETGDEDWKCCLVFKIDQKRNNFLRREDWAVPGGTQHCEEEMAPAEISYGIYLILFTIPHSSCRIVPCQQLVSCENLPSSSLCPSN